MTRIYHPDIISLNQTLRLTESASHHLARVLRAKIGDKLALFNGLSPAGDYQAEITAIDKKSVEVSIKAFYPKEIESPIQLYLAQGIAKGEKMDFIIQKAVELGVSGIIPLMTERCNVRLDKEREAKRLIHWEAVAISACEQSGRNQLVSIIAPLTLKEWLPQVKTDARYVLSPTGHSSAFSADNVHSITLVVGPEGGLSEAEVKLAQQYDFQPLALGPRILRTETAGLAALSVLQYEYGDF